jgi:hypothetical protein
MGPGSTPPSFSGYLAFDHAGNYGAAQSDWTINYQIYAATLNTGGTYYADAARYPCGAMYHPAGNTDPNNSYFVYFAPAFCNTTTASWGGMCYGRSKWGTQSDTTKHLDWYSPPPYRDIQKGFYITALGKAFSIGNDYEYNGAPAYYDNILLFTGTWDNTAKDFTYEENLIPCPSNLGVWPSITKIAADPSGNHVWIAAITNNGEATPVFDSTYYPVFWHSSDGGATWSNSMAVTLDGPDGIPAILNYISDSKLAEVYAPNPAPPRDQVAYTCVFDGDLTVDKWGNPHFAVGIALPGGGFSVISPDGANSPLFDSTMAVFDITSKDRGATWCGRMMGITKRFRCNGTSSSGATTLDLRTNISRNAAGDKIFVSWNDTWLTSVTDNSAPDIFLRGWDLVTDKLTNAAGQDAGTNVTYLSDVTQQAYAGDQAQEVFTKPDGSSLIPLACEIIPSINFDNPVTFKYIPDFSYPQSAFTIPAQGPAWGSNCDWPVGINETTAQAGITAAVVPNPLHGEGKIRISVPQNGATSISVTNLVGQSMLSLSRNLSSGENTLKLDVSSFPAGVYFYSVIQGSEKVTGKMIVE